METMHGFGLMAGPFLGGLLYEIGGFYFPFAICGGILMLCAVLSALFLTNDRLSDNHASGLSNDVSEDINMALVPTTYWQLLRRPSIVICCILLIIAETSVTW